MIATFDPRQVNDRHLTRIVLKRSGSSVTSTLDLTLRRIGDFELLPDQIVLKRDAASSTYVGEAILRSRVNNINVNDVDVHCDAIHGEKIDVRMERINDRCGRVYFSLSDKSLEKIPSQFSVVFQVSGGAANREIKIPIQLAN
ncbi:MAG: hypothetical protein ABL921_03315 [Pirellula sp.]